jgi:hypothetical protein
MSVIVSLATARRQSRAALHATWLAGGSLVVYDSPQPANADTALSSQTTLVTFTLPDPFGEVTDGVMTADTIATAMIANNGMAAWARAYDSTDAVIGDYMVGLVNSGSAVEIDNLNLVAGAYATITSMVVSEG